MIICAACAAPRAGNRSLTACSILASREYRAAHGANDIYGFGVCDKYKSDLSELRKPAMELFPRASRYGGRDIISIATAGVDYTNEIILQFTVVHYLFSF